MKFVIIQKDYSETNKKNGPFAEINKLMPDEYPLECMEKQYKSLEDAQNDNKGKRVFAENDYKNFQELLLKNHMDKIMLMELKSKELGVKSNINEIDKKKKLKEIREKYNEIQKRVKKQMNEGKRPFWKFWG